jgi:DNA repair protein RadC
MKLAALPSEEWPRERLRRRGASSLSLAELLAVLLRTGSKGRDVLELASELLREFGNAKGLSRATEEEMLSFPGLGEAKACVLLAALELGKRIHSEKCEPEDGSRGRSAFLPLRRSSPPRSGIYRGTPRETERDPHHLRHNFLRGTGRSFS